MDNTQWHQTNDKQYVYADKTGKILAKIILKQDYWSYNHDEYLTLGLAKAAVEADPKLNKDNDFPWN